MRRNRDNVARSVELMGLKYVVLTSVDRDDLADGGAAHYAAAIRAIKQRNPGTAVEALTPDFAGRDARRADRDRFGTGCVRAECRDRRAARRTRCAIRAPAIGRPSRCCAAAKRHRPAVLTKTSLMLGLGETDAEIARDA